MPTSPKHHEPFDLDSLERDDAVKEPFEFTLNGHRFLMGDPQEIDYRDLLAVYRSANSGDFEEAMGRLLDGDGRETFFEQRVPTWKLAKLFDAYIKHYGLPSPGERRALPR